MTREEIANYVNRHSMVSGLSTGFSMVILTAVFIHLNLPWMLFSVPVIGFGIAYACWIHFRYNLDKMMPK